ncbi:MAG: protoporphyrinogen oxidase HemJ [Rhodospirillales bacterium]|nr:protoporphyrinogen oxidase HemJ [Rhodospirillales bacterium]
MDGNAYLWYKALHIISVIAWMAGLLYLPRLFVYHTEVDVGSETSEKFKIMERRLIRAIMHPAAISSTIFGFLLVYEMDAWMEGWFHAKLLCIIFMYFMHWQMMRWRMDFAEDRNSRSQKFYRFANEGPTLLMIFIVIIVVIKPF